MGRHSSVTCPATKSHLRRRRSSGQILAKLRAPQISHSAARRGTAEEFEQPHRYRAPLHDLRPLSRWPPRSRHTGSRRQFGSHYEKPFFEAAMLGSRRRSKTLQAILIGVQALSDIDHPCQDVRPTVTAHGEVPAPLKPSVTPANPAT